MPEKCKDCCSRLFCMSVAEVNGEDFETMVNKKDCRKRVFTNADRIRAMSDEQLARWLDNFFWGSCENVRLFNLLKWLKQPVEE